MNFINSEIIEEGNFDDDEFINYLPKDYAINFAKFKGKFVDDWCLLSNNKYNKVS